MKYILYPFWVIICLWLVVFYLLIFIIFYALGLLWNFKPIKFTWGDFTEEDFGCFERKGYDKNPKETFIRHLTLGEYKNHKL
jgi:hypothetical protein